MGEDDPLCQHLKGAAKEEGKETQEIYEVSQSAWFDSPGM